ncbi:uncharacterized protein LOC118344201 [Juglans regia]|uniref:Uncharacterized protein LOC118344201 n=1 Tax=Juglans regia TaxID=51240 RepID=A0A6P9DY75_JUGRE|nr:uncharacterized protein LOC118344201 [Juglans regia]
MNQDALYAKEKRKQGLPKKELEKTVAIMKSIWGRRNELNQGGSVRGRRCWKQPEGNTLKANFDAALDINNQRMRIGIIVRDNNGNVLASMTSQRRYIVSPFLAECNAMWRAMELCKKLGFQEVSFEGDARSVIEAVVDEEVDESGRGQVVEDLKKMLRSCWYWTLTFTHREGNVVAHNLAKMALFTEGEFSWIESVPKEIKQLVVNDRICNDLSI